MHRLLLGAVLASSTALSAQPPADALSGPPGRGRVFLSPMGEPFRSSDPAADVVGAWFGAADSNRDGVLVLAEVEADAARFFAALDSNADGELGPEEIARYETAVAPEVQLGMQMRAHFGGAGWGGGGRRGHGGWGGARSEGRGDGGDGGRRRFAGSEYDEGLEGAGRYSFLNVPEPVIAADAELNRGVSRAEFLRAAGQRFLLLDTNKDGRLSRAELPPLPERHGRKGKNKKMPPRPREGTPLPDD